jgi:outer membrane receptor for ferrienterochelin and colicins
MPLQTPQIHVVCGVPDKTHIIVRNDVENKIITESWNRTPGAVLSYQNVNQAKINGWEANAWYDLTQDLSLNANYSQTNAEDKQSGAPFTLTPEDSYSLQVKWLALEGLSTFLGIITPVNNICAPK